MIFLNPAALAFLALAPVVVALYLRRIRRRAAPVSTLLFWRRVVAESPRRAWLGRLRRWLSLLLQLLLFTLLLLALVRPDFPGFTAAAGETRATVLVLDCRARMQTRTTMTKNNNDTRFAQARALAAAYARRAGGRNPVALLAASGPSPRVLASFSDDPQPLLQALDALRSTDAGGTLDAAVALADELLAAQPGVRTGSQREILLLTDLPPLGAVDWHTRAAVRTVPLADVANAAPLANVALVRAAVRALPASPESGAVFLKLANDGSQRATGTVELSFDGQVFDVRPFDLAPGENRAVTYPALPARPASAPANARGWLEARITLPAGRNDDALPLDDHAYAVFAPTRPLRVLLVTPGNWFLENLLRAAGPGSLDFEQLLPDAFRPETAASFDAVIFDDFLPAVDFDSPENLPAAGNFLFIRRAPFSSQSTPTLDRPPVTDLDPASPLLRLVDWRNVGILRAANFPDPTAAEAETSAWHFQVPVRSLGHPLVLTGERRENTARRRQRFAALAFGLAESDLPLRVAFPLFMSNTLRWLAGRDDDADATINANSLRAGDTVTLLAGDTLWTRPQRGSPRPLPEPLPATEIARGPGVFQPMENGFYLLRRATGGDTWLAVNTDDPEMSKINAPAAEEATRVQPALNAPLAAVAGRWSEALRRWPPWVWCAAAALALSALEWRLFHRRRTE